MTDAKPHAEVPLSEGTWRAPVLDASLKLGAALGSLWLVSVLLAYPAVLDTPEFFAILPGFVAAWLGVVFRGWPEMTRIRLLLFFCWNISAVTIAMAGPRPAAVVLTLLSVLLATLYLGWKGGVIATGAALTLFVAAAFGWTHGLLPLSPVFIGATYDQTRPWIGGTVVVLFGAAAVSVIVAYVLGHASRALRRARESEEKFATAFRASPDAIVITDAADGRIIEINVGFERLFGHARDEAVGKTSIELGLWVDPREREEINALVLRDGAAHGVRGRGRHRDGTTTVFEVSVELIELGGRRCMVGIVRDITERLRQEEVREQLETQVRESQKLEALGTLAGGIAHDFNNILMAILNFADLARTDADNAAEVRAHLSEVIVAGVRAKDLVRQILAFSRKQPNKRQPTSLDVVANEALKLLRATLPRTLEIKAAIDPLCPPVLADPSQMHQVLMNLGTNAAHALRDRPGTLTVQVDCVMLDVDDAALLSGLKAGPHVRLTVTDTGQGMTEAVRARIFEPFFTTKAPGEGTGLGLAVVHGIVRTHDGAITVESEEGRGTRFVLHFPALEAPTTREETPEGGARPGRGERILVIDDEPAVCRALARGLDRLGFEVEACVDPVEAVARLRAVPKRYDLVLTDLAMPQLTGIDVARAALAARPELPVLLMTGHTASWTRESVRREGVRDMLVKPLSPAEIAHAIHGALAETRSA